MGSTELVTHIPLRVVYVLIKLQDEHECHSGSPGPRGRAGEQDVLALDMHRLPGLSGGGRGERGRQAVSRAAEPCGDS